ncbi:MAG TPA: hypothetical protein VK424_00405 [Thermoplasmata archaeon]|nr:hypothetical protein [Thermoplasmata archaeon]
MALRRREVELSVERPLGSGHDAGTVRLSARFETPEDGKPTPRELGEAMDRLRADLDALVGAPLAAAPALRPDRELPELIEAYHPRQRVLLDLLRDEGELTAVEHARLVEYLVAGGEPIRPAPPARPNLVDQPLAAAPIIADRSPEGARSVSELVRTYQIETLKQAGAVRARRQISFAEYMALKRHFESVTPPASAPPGSPPA